MYGSAHTRLATGYILLTILMLVAPRFLNYFVAQYLNVVGLEPPVRFEAAQSPAGTPA